MLKLRGTVATIAITAASVALAPYGMASSHREAPAITEDPKIDGTDFYMFRSYASGRSEFVTIIANYQPLQEPFGGPNYFTMDPDAVYEIHIDNDGDAIEDITFQFDFNNELRNETGIALEVAGQQTPIPLRYIGQVTNPNDPDLNELEFYTVRHIVGDRRSGKAKDIVNVAGGSSPTIFQKPLDNVGNKTIPDYDAYARQFIYDITIPGCPVPGRVFVGQREEGFAINLGETFDLVNYVPIEGEINQSRTNGDLIDQFNITSLALEVPIACLTGDGNGVIGGWTTSGLPQAELRDPSPTYEQPSIFGGAIVQQSRLGNPLINEVVIGLVDKNAFNSSEPVNDLQPLTDITGLSVADYAQKPTLPEILEVLFPVTAPNFFPRVDLVAAFATGIEGLNQMKTVTPSEMLRLNTNIPPVNRAEQETLGALQGDVAGYPNGRRPGDDVVDIALRVVMGRLCYDLPGGIGNLGLCEPKNAPDGNLPYTDGAPIFAPDPRRGALEFQNQFPYLNTPLPGSPDEARPAPVE